MNRSILCLLTIFLLLISCQKENSTPLDCGLLPDKSTAPVKLNVLFIGTSHTYYHDLPNLMAAIATSMGDSLYTEMSAPGGYDFERHHQLPETRSALSSRNWDYIVLQESGWRTALPASIAATTIYPFADSLLGLIESTNKEAKLILYMTHGYIGGVKALADSAWCSNDPQVCTYEGMQERIKETYLHLANQMQATIAPCGVMWKILKSKNNHIDLHDADGIHPSLIGAYANALTLYSVIRAKPIANVYIPDSLQVAQAEFIQHTISTTLFDCLPNWKSF